MFRILRDSFWGQIVYHASGKKLFQNPEERPDFVLPEKYILNHSSLAGDTINRKPSGNSRTSTDLPEDLSSDIEKTGNESSEDTNNENADPSSGYIIVDWYGPDDPENPHNWPIMKKVFLGAQIGFLTFSIYVGSSIYTPGILEIMEDFKISQVMAILPLSLFVVGYGIGPMIFSPLSEHPKVGRTYIYIVTLFIFVILQIPTALSKNIGSLLALRFLAGFVASPALATGGASMGDVFSYSTLPIGLAAWSISAVCGPALGPLIGGAFAQTIGWRWTIWALACISGGACAFLSLFLPETSTATILYRRAVRLRKLTGNQNIRSEGEVSLNSMTVKEVAVETLWRPFEITLTEPVVFFLNSYIALLYACMYTWFEAFPIVFNEVHHFNLVESGLAYIGIIVCCIIACGFYLYFVRIIWVKKLEAGINMPPEIHLVFGIAGSIIVPVGIFLFAWTSKESVHWIAPIIGSGIFVAGAFLVFQATFNYFGGSFFRYLASVFAGNGLFRASFAAAFPLFATPMYKNLGPTEFPVGYGCTIIGCICVAMISIPITLRIFGPKLRARSRYAN
ncbi:SCR1 protein [Nadsonia fulvescens var. elongata DSM 6958]|uniref:SCR1 protein n=1 Tax=Nadsonia fulvescens var. elongata DSM 6958 TaxID=857566 RepID=A0A1E3PJA3_9ASCO|nr:SCR1 protein [Nadsonia fulvescens var. elongata DSM 6958]